MKQFDANSNNPENNLEQNFSNDGVQTPSVLENDFVLIKEGIETEGLLLDSKGFVQGVVNDYRLIVGKELFKSALLLLLFTSASILGVFNGYWDTGKYDTSSLIWIQETLESTETNHINPGNTTVVTEKPEAVPLGRTARKIISIRTHAENNNLVLTLPLKPVISNVQTSKIAALDFNSDVINNNSSTINAFTFNKIKGNWIPLIDKESANNNYLQQTDYINAKSNYNQEYSPPLISGRYEENQLHHNELINIPSFKGKEITVLSACLTDYQKTDMEVKKDMILFLSSHGTISIPACGLSSEPEGVRTEQAQIIHCEPFMNEFRLGALLYRFGNDDNWKVYSATQGSIVVEKDGLLELRINARVPDKELIKGNYAVAVSTSEMTLNR